MSCFPSEVTTGFGSWQEARVPGLIVFRNVGLQAINDLLDLAAGFEQ